MCIRDRTKAHFQVTRLATTGGFLLAGNTTFLCGTDDEKVDEAIEIVGKHSKKRTQLAVSYTHLDVYKRQLLWWKAPHLRELQKTGIWLFS